jgi:mRNA interferase MazF
VRRGEVWTVADGQSRWRVVVLSADGYNERGHAYCLPVVRQTSSATQSPYAVRLADPDPVSGIAVVDVVRRFPARAGVERVGMLTGATFTRIESVFRDLFDL